MAIKCFAMYSWDSDEHQLWVKKLVDNLIEYGIDATLDIYELGLGTKNLNRMMIDNIFNDGFLIVVMTDEYTKKANEETGGVGFETTSLMGIMKNNETRNRVILVKKEKDIPNYLLDYEYIDFSSGITEEKIKEIVRKITGNPLHKKPPLGKKKIEDGFDLTDSLFKDINIPNLNPINKENKQEFIVKSIDEIKNKLENGFLRIKNNNPNFTYTIEEKKWVDTNIGYQFLNNTMVKEPQEIVNYLKIELFLDNELVKSTNFWNNNTKNSWNKESISYSYNQYSWGNDNFSPSSFNGYLSVIVDENNELKFKSSMGILNGQEINIDEFINELLNSEYIPELKRSWDRKYKY